MNFKPIILNQALYVIPKDLRDELLRQYKFALENTKFERKDKEKVQKIIRALELAPVWRPGQIYQDVKVFSY